ncbi:MAG: hypothetical protein ACRDRH_08280 [Pseudonocardia sp.]
MSDQPDLSPECPSLRNEHEQARLIMLPEFTTGLDGLSDFDYAWLISWLHPGDLDLGAHPPRQGRNPGW